MELWHFPSYNSQKIRELIDNGRIIVSSFNEARIQHSFFEPVIGDEIFIMDTEKDRLFRPKREERVYKTLLQLPAKKRQRVDIRGGFELKKGFTYMIPLEDKVRLLEDEHYLFASSEIFKVPIDINIELRKYAESKLLNSLCLYL